MNKKKECWQIKIVFTLGKDSILEFHQTSHEEVIEWVKWSKSVVDRIKNVSIKVIKCKCQYKKE